MGRDKASMRIGDGLLVERVISALSSLDSITLVGGDESDPARPRLPWCEDRYPGEGPLGAVISGMHAVEGEIIVSSACDLPRLRPETVVQLVDTRAACGADAAVPLIGGRWQWHLVAWHRRALEPLEDAFDKGERSLHRAALALRCVAVVFSHTAQFTDLDTPADVSREFPGELGDASADYVF